MCMSVSRWRKESVWRVIPNPVVGMKEEEKRGMKGVCGGHQEAKLPLPSALAVALGSHLPDLGFSRRSGPLSLILQDDCLDVCLGWVRGRSRWVECCLACGLMAFDYLLLMLGWGFSLDCARLPWAPRFPDAKGRFLVGGKIRRRNGFLDIHEWTVGGGILHAVRDGSGNVYTTA